MRRAMTLGLRAVAAALVIVVALNGPTLAQAKEPVSGVLTATDPANGGIKLRTSAGEETYEFEAVLLTIGGKSKIGGRSVSLRDFKVGDRVRLEFSGRGRLIHIAKD